ncbi:MAG: hypothetical protein NXI18_17595 [Alphaproteobacteria bacterium]|nr:hypothetical protein [Alphaproteobacteria bacterium]
MARKAAANIPKAWRNSLNAATRNEDIPLSTGRTSQIVDDPLDCRNVVDENVSVVAALQGVLRHLRRPIVS